MPEGQSARGGWSVVATDDRALKIRSYEDGDALDAVFVVVSVARLHRLESTIQKAVDLWDDPIALGAAIVGLREVLGELRAGR